MNIYIEELQNCREEMHVSKLISLSILSPASGLHTPVSDKLHPAYFFQRFAVYCILHTAYCLPPTTNRQLPTSLCALPFILKFSIINFLEKRGVNLLTSIK
jgi:hypothetical protein